MARTDVLTYPTPGIKEVVTCWSKGREIIERGELYQFLQCALEVELTTIPPYLTAMCSMRGDRNREAYAAIRGVVREEMLHLTLVANIMNAVGCAPALTGVLDAAENDMDVMGGVDGAECVADAAGGADAAPDARGAFADRVAFGGDAGPGRGGGDSRVPANVPTYPCVLPFTPTADHPIALRHFSPAAMETFIAIEGPDEPWEIPDHGWRSIGHFYRVLREGLQRLAADDERQRDQRRRLFPTDPKVRAGRLARQVGPEHFHDAGGEVIKVTDLRGALAALDIVAEQGEGLHPTLVTGDDARFGERRQGAHFFAFREIYHGRRYGPYDRPDQPPGGEPVDVDWASVHPVDVIDSDAKRLQRQPVSERYRSDSEPALRPMVERFNRVYARWLAQCHWSFNGAPYLLEQAIPTLLRLRHLAEEIFRNPLPDADGKDRLHACPTFEVTAESIAREHALVRDHARVLRRQRARAGEEHARAIARMRDVEAAKRAGRQAGGQGDRRGGRPADRGGDRTAARAPAVEFDEFDEFDDVGAVPR